MSFKEIEPEPKPKEDEPDIDAAIDRQQEVQDNFPNDDYEDLSTYMDQYRNDFI